MPVRLKRILIAAALCLFLFALLRIGTSSYENHVRSLGSVPYAR